MQTFEELLKQETLDYCVSGHSFDTGMSFEELLEFYRRRNLREEKDVEFVGAAEKGSNFFIDDLVYVSVYHPPIARRVAQAKELGIDVRSHVSIHPGEEYYNKQGLNAAHQELKALIQYHTEQKISATCYFPHRREFQGVNKT